MNLYQELIEFPDPMEDIKRLQALTSLELSIYPQGHSVGASVFHLLKMCTGVRNLVLTFDSVTHHPEVILSLLCFSDTWYAFIFLGTPRLELLV
jgi:hypothetical protein